MTYSNDELFHVEEQASRMNNFEHTSWVYYKEYEFDETDATLIGVLPKDVTIVSFNGDNAVYMKETTVTVSFDRQQATAAQIEALRDKVKEVATTLVVVASALTLGVVSWGACHPEKTPGELLYPDTWEGPSELRYTPRYNVPCNSVSSCILRDAKADALVEKAMEAESVSAIDFLVEDVCTTHSFLGTYIPSECKEVVEPIKAKALDKLNKRFDDNRKEWEAQQ